MPNNEGSAGAGRDGSRLRDDRQLFIDLDGVLADFDAFYEQQFGVKLDRGIPNDPPGMWENISGHGSFYADLPLMADALALWEGAKRLHPNPIILTGCPHSVPNVEDHKRAWVRRHIAPDAVVITCKSKDKRNFGKPGDVLIDDWHKYRPLWEQMGGIFILHKSAATSLAQAEGLFRRAVPDPLASDTGQGAIDPPTTVPNAEREALLQMFEAYQELKRLGWLDIVYCPKDGTHLDAIEAGSTGIHDANYQGTWPNGCWWIYDGDISPSRPILFRLKRDPKRQPSEPVNLMEKRS